MALLGSRRKTEDAGASVRVLRSDEGERVPESGSAQSVQEADVLVPASRLEELWRPENLERLARAYWRFLTRISLGLIRVLYGPDSRTIVLLSRRLPLLRFHAPEFETSPMEGVVTWRIKQGLLVAREGRGRGYLRIAVRRSPADGPAANGSPDGDLARVRIFCEVRNFYPWLRGHGRFARVGVWLYSQTQLRIHVIVCNAFLRSLARLDLPPPRVRALPADAEPS